VTDEEMRNRVTLNEEHRPAISFPAGAPNPLGRRGVVAIILRDNTFLVIRRSQQVAAPGLICFAGGGIEAGESPAEALIREMDEELSLDVRPVEQVWDSVTSWGTSLCWWTAEIAADAVPVPNPAEVAEVFWLSPEQLSEQAGLLPSMPQFLAAWRAGLFELPISP